MQGQNLKWKIKKTGSVELFLCPVPPPAWDQLVACPPREISRCICSIILSLSFQRFFSSFPVKLPVKHTDRALMLPIKAKFNRVAPRAASWWNRANSHQRCFQQKAQLESIWSPGRLPQRKLLRSRLPAAGCLTGPDWSSC